MGVIADAAAKVVGESSEASTPSVGHGIPRTSEASPPAAPAAEVSPTSATAPVSRTSDAAPSAPPEQGTGKPTESHKPGAQPGQPVTPSGGDPTVALKQARSENRKLKQTYGWLPNEHVSGVKGFYESLSRDRIGTLVGELKPDIDKPGVRERVARELGISLPPSKDDLEPDFDVETPDGRPFMSPQRAAEWRAWHQRQTERRLDERVRPISQYLEERQLVDLNNEMRAEAQGTARRLFAEAQTWEHFREHMPEIRDRFNMLTAPPEEGGYGMKAEPALLRAYQSTLLQKVRDGSLQAGRAQAAAMQSKVTATTHNPSRPAAAAGTSRPLSIRESAERVVYGRAS